MELKKIPKISLKGKKILLRIDINSAIYKNKILDSPRFSSHAKTIKWLSDKKARVVILSHQGRKGKNDFVSNLKRHAIILERHSKKKIEYVDDLFGEIANEKICGMKNGEIILLKNVRDYSDEKNVNEKKNKYIKFSKKFDFFINDAFSICHRKQASIIIPPKIISGYAGPVLLEEFNFLKKFNSLENKKLLLVLGGKKIEDYAPLFNFLKKKNAKMIAGGVVANLILYNQGLKFGYEEKWLKENDCMKILPKLKRIINKEKRKIILPLDFAVRGRTKRRNEIYIRQLPIDKKIMDVGKESVRFFRDSISKAEVVLMKGPFGFSEIPGFEYGTVEILKEISRQTKKKKLYSLIGGGNLTTTIDEYNLGKGFSYISLSGGALIEFITHKKLPGLEVLKK